ncbi:NAD(P)-dependent oxidoreductase [Pseudomaricurvus sp. HS19]|uniref:NAD-dependent epimerase/dehydratase family protein n=1 Tax=Pseudomaricurvus sp. HS19 TaxID=2692626 RepID=UPI0013717427|nr:NAD-dependent epimerase/dehydratase family protein [Pseudomaricurvus sp. HS19]MYM62866.1 NAD-dependent epimerase/dehydratase family protein [Pseudomaricurvus sp. HS19]
MNVLITGGAGFIGTALAGRLVDLLHNVVVFDLSVKIESLENPVQGVKYVGGDISDVDSLWKLVKEKFHVIFHLASQTSGLISQENPTLDVDTNVKGSLNVCRLAHAMQSKIIFTSSMAVYGDHELPISEDFQMEPCSNYGVSKVCAETYIKLFRKRGVKSTIFRLFNVYGPGQDLANLKQGMLSIYVAQLIQSGKIDVTGSLSRYRDFVYIDDVVDALIMGIDNSLDGQIFNVGTGVKTTVDILIAHIVRESGQKDVKITNVGGFEGDQFGTYANCEKLQSYGWNPKVSLEVGLKSTYADAMRVLL